MRDHLILQLQGVMQAWGEHTFEGLRPTANFPTRSGLVGLLGACIGIDRTDFVQQQALADSVQYAVRQDESKRVWDLKGKAPKSMTFPCDPIKATDYHTVKDARKEYTGLKTIETIQTWREYLYDGAFTVAIWSTDGTVAYTLDNIQKALAKPHYTPFLGRRSCPISRPLFETRVAAINADEALGKIAPAAGIIYSEEAFPDMKGRSVSRYRIRDVPLSKQPRQFATRMVYVYGKGSIHVSE